MVAALTVLISVQVVANNITPVIKIAAVSNLFVISLRFVVCAYIM
jgi:hypothetical protein